MANELRVAVAAAVPQRVLADEPHPAPVTLKAAGAGPLGERYRSLQTRLRPVVGPRSAKRRGFRAGYGERRHQQRGERERAATRSAGARLFFRVRPYVSSWLVCFG